MVYQWRYTMPVPAQIAGRELERIERVHGAVTPENVLEESREEGTVLHEVFEWRDDVAAEKYRLSQAGSLIRNLIVKIEDIEEAPVTRAFVNISDERKGRYVCITNAMADEAARILVLEQAMRELKAFEKKYADLEELADIFAAIHNVA